MQRQPDGAFVLAQHSGDPSGGRLAVAAPPDLGGEIVQTNRALRVRS
jgi:hypothetical protein